MTANGDGLNVIGIVTATSFVGNGAATNSCQQGSLNSTLHCSTNNLKVYTDGTQKN